MEREIVRDYVLALEASESAANTVRVYGSQLRGFAEFMARQGVTGWDRVTKEHCSTWIERALKDSTRAMRHDAFTGFWPWLKQQGIVHTNPMEGLERPKEPKRAPSRLSEADVRRLIETARKQSKGLSGTRDVAIVELLYATGVSSSELVAINVGDITWEWSQIHIEGGSHCERSVHMTATAREAVERWLEQRKVERDTPTDDSPLFISLGKRQEPRRLPERTVQTTVKELGRSIGLEGVRPQTLRSSFAFHLLSRGADPEDVAELLGNVSGRNMMRYTRSSKRIHREHHPRP